MNTDEWLQNFYSEIEKLSDEQSKIEPTNNTKIDSNSEKIKDDIDEIDFNEFLDENLVGETFENKLDDVIVVDEKTAFCAYNGKYVVGYKVDDEK